MLKQILLVFVFFLLSSTAFAEVIHLNNGRTVEGLIVERTGYGVIIEVNGIRRTYYKSEIARIEESKPEPAEQALSEGSVPAAAVPDFSEIPPQKAELALRVLEAIGARSTIAATFDRIIKEAPEESRPRLQAILKVDEVLKWIAPLYTQRYTEEEMKELIRFYMSPVGQKHLELTPTIVEDSMRQTFHYFQEKMTEYDQTHPGP